MSPLGLKVTLFALDILILLEAIASIAGLSVPMASDPFCQKWSTLPPWCLITDAFKAKEVPASPSHYDK